MTIVSSHVWNAYKHHSTIPAAETLKKATLPCELLVLRSTAVPGAYEIPYACYTTVHGAHEQPTSKRVCVCPEDAVQTI